jgi:hypothetical protein
MIFEGAASRIAGFSAAVAGWMSMLVLLAAVFLVAVCLQQGCTARLAPWTTNSAKRMFEVVPALDWQVWLIIFVVLFYVFRTLRGLKRRLGQREAKLPGL